MACPITNSERRTHYSVAKGFSLAKCFSLAQGYSFKNVLKKGVAAQGLAAAVLALFLVAASGSSLAAVPAAQIVGPIAADPAGSGSRNAIHSASAIELTAHGYVEEEFFIEGSANTYALDPEQPMADAAVESEGHRYRTRLVVRRPRAEDFNGVVLVEWMNVTGGVDKDIDWWQSGAHLVANGYAYVFVSAQQMGIDNITAWSPERYAGLDATHDGMVKNDASSYDIFSAVAKAVVREGEAARGIDILSGLRARQILATGHSQSASRLAVYLNSIHPLDPVFDGVIVHGGGGLIRDDQPVKIFKLMAETDMLRRAATPQPNSDNFRQWEVAGSSHVDVPFEIEYGKVRAQQEGLPTDNISPRDSGCELPAYSTVPFRDVMNAAFEHMVRWVDEGTAPPVAEPIQLARAFPSVEFARDARGNVLGGIRLAEHAVPTAKNTGLNTGANRFCFLYGSHEPFDAATLRALYPSAQSYVDAVRAVAQGNVEAGFILPAAAERTVRQAQARAW